MCPLCFKDLGEQKTIGDSVLGKPGNFVLCESCGGISRRDFRGVPRLLTNQDKILLRLKASEAKQQEIIERLFG